jgi:hypothetical protein
MNLLFWSWIRPQDFVLERQKVSIMAHDFTDGVIFIQMDFSLESLVQVKLRIHGNFSLTSSKYCTIGFQTYKIFDIRNI